MELITTLIDFILHIDKHLVNITQEYQAWTYLILFLIIFAETGLVVTPFLPGDSVLFAAGALIAKPETNLNIFVMMGLLIAAAIIGDFVNYEIGKHFGARVFKPGSKIFKSAYLEKTQGFYQKYGLKTIIYARFVPIVRTFAPFVAGIVKMPYRQFGAYNIIGGVLWVALFLSVGYFFGQIPFVKNNFSLVVLAIICISLLPPIIEVLKGRFSKRQKLQ
ncbi:DedA family protein [Sphingobacterium sp. DK4209]|uniref:DedA family protein n=1 Tax=Sphingobacterium zhuxiongii TaxID=2662364 RepID=A0A5Q0Q6E9_9SPHI|nr:MULTISPECIES: DedA family protein [unclassified Sphingobacterium]MVZ65843.1 DedA family protein [Sphingobacterium sp. DK4209]QGA24814.1 DedA family protein [Sphingobacterium sp. dk4302]